MGKELTDLELLSMLLFSETKDLNDAFGVANVVKNRLNTGRWGKTLKEVIYSPHQFSGVNSNEWKKVASGKMTPQEQEIYKQLQGVSEAILTNAYGDETMGATHYFNPKLVKPKWSAKMKQTYKTGSHEYYRE